MVNRLALSKIEIFFQFQQTWSGQSSGENDHGPLLMKPLSEGAEEDLAHGGLSGSQPESSAGPSSVGSSAHNTPGNKTNYCWSYFFRLLLKK